MINVVLDVLMSIGVHLEEQLLWLYSILTQPPGIHGAIVKPGEAVLSKQRKRKVRLGG